MNFRLITFLSELHCAKCIALTAQPVLFYYFRYIESRQKKGFINLKETDIVECLSSENPMFEVYKTMATEVFNEPLKYDFDFKLFITLKQIITQLVVVKPENRMKLQDARTRLDELDQFTKMQDFNFLLLKSFLQNEDDPTLTNTDETTQNSLRLMNEIRSTRLFTIPTTGDDKKLTQRLTNLCVAVSAMRLLSYALVDFLEKHFTGDRKKFQELTDKILKYPDNPESSKKTPEEREAAREPVLEAGPSSNAPDGFKQGYNPVKKEPFFIHKLITICCGVISPRSLNGLNHCHLDDNFHIAAQEQNIRKFS